MTSEQMRMDEKGSASITFGDVVRQTANNFPDSRFRPNILASTTHYTFGGINPYPFQFWPTADGIGTKPELAERLYERSKQIGAPDPSFYRGLAFDTIAMIDGDEARFGRYMVGVVEVVDLNSAKDAGVVTELARGLKEACDFGHFALLNGETAELGYRTSGYGDSRLNWNAVGISIVNPNKLLLGEELAPGQPVIAIREKSIRSNGLSKARAILEADYLVRHGYPSKIDYIVDLLEKQGIHVSGDNLDQVLENVFGHSGIEQVLVPWHIDRPDVTKELLTPSMLYGPLMYAVRGIIDEDPPIHITAASHISGGGVPEKMKRMVEAKGFGVYMEPVFPDPAGVTSLLEIASSLPEDALHRLKIDERVASEQWNRGVGFAITAADESEADLVIEVARSHGYEAAIAGEIIDKPEIHWRENVWTYNA